jgi:glycosyltransferase involved in cell wall biosynthesis
MNPTTPTKFSIATPVFNGMPALARCIGSVRGQCVDVQHVVQDGGSTDGSVEFLRKFESENGNQRSGVSGQRPEGRCPGPGAYSFMFSSENDEGMYDAINKAWGKADGDILSWLNSDEQYLPGTLEKVADYFEAHPDVDAVFGNTIITDAEGHPYAARREIPLRKRYVANGILYALSCTTFYRRKLWDKGWLKLDTNYRYSSDADLALRLLDHGVRYGHINDYLALFGVETGRNLSFLPAMKVESDQIKRKHGGFAVRPLQRLVRCGRVAERVLKGCYRSETVRYAYAVDEVPQYVPFEHPRLGFRFTYEKFAREDRDS